MQGSLTNAAASLGELIIMLPSRITAVFSAQKNVASVELALTERSPSGMSLMSGSPDSAT